MNPQLARLYEALTIAGCLPGGAGPSELARILETTPQKITNWADRGPSKEGLLDVQSRFGVNATWVLEGVGPMFVGGQGNPWRLPGISLRKLSQLRKEDLIRIETAWLLTAERFHIDVAAEDPHIKD